MRIREFNKLKPGDVLQIKDLKTRRDGQRYPAIRGEKLTWVLEGATKVEVAELPDELHIQCRVEFSHCTAMTLGIYPKWIRGRK